MSQIFKAILSILTCSCVLCSHLSRAEIAILSRNKHETALVVNESEKDAPQAAGVSAKQDSGKSISQAKDISDVVPISNTITRVREDTGVTQANDVVNLAPVTVNDTDRTKAAMVTTPSQMEVADAGVGQDSGKSINQAKDISDVGQILNNITLVREATDVTQANDVINVVPVAVNDSDRTEAAIVPTPTPLEAVEEKVQPISDIPFVDLRIKFDSIGTEFCREKSRCNSTISPKTCACDRVCGVLEDCCKDAEVVHDANLTLNQFNCVYMPGVSESLMVVTKCAPFWNDDVTKTLCEESATPENIFAQIPVSDLTLSGLIYKNRHCAHCNNIYDYEYWRAMAACLKDPGEINITHITDTKNCKISYQPANESSTFRKCNVYPNVIKECEASNSEEEVREKCNNDSYSIVYSNVDKKYRNEYCAICNGVDEKDLYCQPQHRFFASEKSKIRPRLHTFRLIVDFNTKWVFQNSEMKTAFNACRENEIYDPFSQICREIICPPLTMPSQGKCEPVPEEVTTTLLNFEKNISDFTSTKNCTLIKIKSDEFEFVNETNEIIIRKIKINETEYLKNGTDIFVCSDKLNIKHVSPVSEFSIISMYKVNEIEGYISLVCLIVSIVALLLTLLVYILFPQLLNVPGKNLICLIISLTVSQVLFLLTAVVVELQTVCTVFAVLMHYFFLCAFCWMNVIAFDLWVTFSHKFVSLRHQATQSKRFYLYSVYAWCLPLLIVGVAVTLNFASFGGRSAVSFKPDYGHGVCWITTKNALLVFFVGPLAVLKLFDLVLFGITAYHISKAKQQGAFARKGPSSSAFLINLRLSLVMGLTWIFAFVANFTNSSVMWYLFIIFNTLQGLFIALSFICTGRVMKLFREKFKASSKGNRTQISVTRGSKSTEDISSQTAGTQLSIMRETKSTD